MISMNRLAPAVLWVLDGILGSTAAAQEEKISLYLEEGKSGAVWDLAYSNDGRTLWSCGRDSTVKAWNLSNGEALLTLKAPRPTLNTSISLSPDGTLVAYGDMNGRLTIREASTGALLHDIAAHKGYVSDLLFMPYGRRVVTCGRDDSIAVWDAESGRNVLRFRAGCLWVNAIAISGDGVRLAGAGQDGTVRLWDAGSGMETAMLGVHSRFAKCVLFSADDRSVISGGRDGMIKVWDAVSKAKLQEFKVDIGFPRRLALDPSGNILAVSMMNGLIEIRDMKRQLRLATLPDSYGAMEAAFDPASGGSRLAGVHTDGSVKVWNLTDASHIISLVGFSDGQWLSFTPDGYYDCSAFGDRYVQWRKGEEMYPLEQYESLYKKPAILEDALAGTYVPEAKLSRIVNPPKARILSPRDGQFFYFGSEKLEIVVEVSAFDEKRIETVQLRLNGRPVPAEIMSEAGTLSRSDTSLLIRFRIQVLPGINTLEAVAFNAARVRSEPAMASVKVETRDRRLPNLFVLSIGIDEFGADFPPLLFASQDARVLADKLREQEGKQYTRVYSRVLLTQDATRKNILDALGQFPAMTPDDILVMFFSGHGVRVRSKKGGTEYAFVSAGANRKNVAVEGMVWTDFSDKLMRAQAGRVILFLDACHSGSVSTGASNEKVAAALADKVGIIFASSSGNEYSFENKAWGHGAFTRSLLDALGGAADFTKNDIIDWSELQLFVTTRVREMTNGTQNPMIPRLEGFANFDVARIDGK